MRAALAAATIVLVLLIAAAPHVHGTPLGTHACAACTVGGGDEVAPQATDAAPRVLVGPSPLARDVDAPPVTGVALGAVPGQSPPVA